MHDYFLDEYDIDISVTGFTAVGIDVSDKLGGALLPFGIIVVGLSLVLLTMVFRSIWVPIKATLGYLLSVCASFGVVALVFENGLFADTLHVASVGPVISFMPIILMGVLFGLAMDYEVFLVSRMREDYVHTGNARKSVETGFVASAKVVTAAAVIMFAVFAAFVPEGDVNIKPIALGLAVGVFVDAFIVRMTLVPAVLAMLGEKAWWMPRWLDRALPSFDVEGAGLHRELELAEWPRPGSTAVIAAEGLTLGTNGGTLYSGVAFELEPGDTLVIQGGNQRAREALLLTIAGRMNPDDGRLKVAGLVVPERAPAVRSRVAYLTAHGDAVASIRAAAAEKPQLLVIDGVDAITDTLARRNLADALESARLDALRDERTLSVVIGTSAASATAELALGDTTIYTLADPADATAGSHSLQEVTA
jgi:RND superfamily putative drug exporter